MEEHLLFLSKMLTAKSKNSNRKQCNWDFHTRAKKFHTWILLMQICSVENRKLLGLTVTSVSPVVIYFYAIDNGPTFCDSTLICKCDCILIRLKVELKK